MEIFLFEIEHFTDTRDGKVYETVNIGEQVWFAENLNYESPNSSYYNDEALIGDQLGRLYTWTEANAVCPNGWYLPSDEEWKALEAFLGMEEAQLDSLNWRGTNEGAELKCGYGWHTNDISINSSYFSALPGGFFNSTSMTFTGGGDDGLFWTATSFSDSKAYYRKLSENIYQVFRNSSVIEHKFSVRCVKDL